MTTDTAPGVRGSCQSQYLRAQPATRPWCCEEQGGQAGRVREGTSSIKRPHMPPTPDTLLSPCCSSAPRHSFHTPSRSSLVQFTLGRLAPSHTTVQSVNSHLGARRRHIPPQDGPYRTVGPLRQRLTTLVSRPSISPPSPPLHTGESSSSVCLARQQAEGLVLGQDIDAQPDQQTRYQVPPPALDHPRHHP